MVSQNRDRQLALGPHGQPQQRFFKNAVDRPDIASFYKRLKSPEKLKVASNLGHYAMPETVRLAELLLVDFDADARAQLGEVLIKFAPEYPAELAKELKNTGGFQKLATFRALRSAFDATLPHVIKQLDITEGRANAAEYLVGEGPKIGAAVMPVLESELAETRLIAADILGKIGYRPAAPRLLDLYRSALESEKTAYLAAISNLGDPMTEPVLIEVLTRSSSSEGDKVVAVLGLGRIATPSAIERLWSLADQEGNLRDRAIEALTLAGGRSLDGGGSQRNRLAVATGITGPRADEVIKTELSNSASSQAAALAAVGRPQLVEALIRRLTALDPPSQGGQIEEIVHALASTGEGRKALQESAVRARYGGFIDRELAKR